MLNNYPNVPYKEKVKKQKDEVKGSDTIEGATKEVGFE